MGLEIPSIHDRRPGQHATHCIAKMDTALAEIRNTMAAILSISRLEMETAGLVERGSLASWNAFRRDPYRWLLRLDKAGHGALSRLLAAQDCSAGPAVRAT